MIYEIEYSDDAKQHAKWLKKSEPAAYRKLQRLIHELKEHPRTGTGKPEQLRGNRPGQWSRRITDRHRLVYVIDDDRVIVLVLSATKHYDDK